MEATHNSPLNKQKRLVLTKENNQCPLLNKINTYTYLFSKGTIWFQIQNKKEQRKRVTIITTFYFETSARVKERAFHL